MAGSLCRCSQTLSAPCTCQHICLVSPFVRSSKAGLDLFLSLSLYAASVLSFCDLKLLMAGSLGGSVS